MGSSSSSVAVTDIDTNDIIKIQERLGKKYSIPLEVQVAHYTPSIFPLVPIINTQINKLCIDSWKLICNKKEMTESGIELSGITLFYNDFYEFVYYNEGVRGKPLISPIKYHQNLYLPLLKYNHQF